VSTYLVIDKKSGSQVCECASLQDAEMMAGFSPGYREIRQRKVLIDQVLDIGSTTIPNDLQLKQQGTLPDREAVPFRG